MKMETIMFIYLLTLLCKGKRWLLEDETIIYLYYSDVTLSVTLKLLKYSFSFVYLIREFSLYKSY